MLVRPLPSLVTSNAIYAGDSLPAGLVSSNRPYTGMGYLLGQMQGFSITNYSQASSMLADVSKQLFGGAAASAYSFAGEYNNINDEVYRGFDKPYLQLYAAGVLARLVRRSAVPGPNMVRGNDAGMTASGTWTALGGSAPDTTAITTSTNGDSASCTVHGKTVIVTVGTKDSDGGTFDLKIGNELQGSFTTSPLSTAVINTHAFGQAYVPRALVFNNLGDYGHEVLITKSNGTGNLTVHSVCGSGTDQDARGLYLYCRAHRLWTTNDNKNAEKYSRAGTHAMCLGEISGLWPTIAKLDNRTVQSDLDPTDSTHFLDIGHLKAAAVMSEAVQLRNVPLRYRFPEEFAEAQITMRGEVVMPQILT